MGRIIRNRPSKQRGLSLLEVMISFSCLAIAFLGVSASTTLFATVRHKNMETQVAVSAARTQLDTIRGTAFNQIEANFDDFGFQVDMDGNGANDLPAVAGDPDGLPGLVTVTQVGPASDPASLLQIDITIRWAAKHGARNYTLSSLVSNRAGS